MVAWRFAASNYDGGYITRVMAEETCCALLFQDHYDMANIDCKATRASAKPTFLAGGKLFLVEASLKEVKRMCGSYNHKEGCVVTEELFRMFPRAIVAIFESAVGKDRVCSMLKTQLRRSQTEEYQFDTPLFAVYDKDESHVYICNVVAIGAFFLLLLHPFLCYLRIHVGTSIEEVKKEAAVFATTSNIHARRQKQIKEAGNGTCIMMMCMMPMYPN